MTKDELITLQQLKIEEQNITIRDAIESAQSIYNMAYAVGGPLNDNILGFNKEQRDYIRRMVSKIESLLPSNE